MLRVTFLSAAEVPAHDHMPGVHPKASSSFASVGGFGQRDPSRKSRIVAGSVLDAFARSALVQPFTACAASA